MPPLLAQAQLNLIGNARDLWIAGIGNIKQQRADLLALEEKTASNGPALKQAIQAAQQATAKLVTWLEQQAPSKTGPSGIGKENYTWSLRNVHLVPLTWEDEVMLLKRELARAHTELKLEEQRNRGLPALPVISSAEEYQRRGNAAVTKYMDFMRARNILPVRDYMDPAMRERIGEYVPEETRNFFGIASHHEPLALYSHFYHWWDLARMREEPHASPLRRDPLLFNIWDSRAEGMATAMEEMMLHAGLYDDNPRGREVVWIMLAQRAARGLGSLYAQANEFTMKQAADFHVEWTPRGWMRPDLDLLGFEQQLYLRQPGYGTSYITGKYLLEQLHGRAQPAARRSLHALALLHRAECRRPDSGLADPLGNDRQGRRDQEDAPMSPISRRTLLVQSVATAVALSLPARRAAAADWFRYREAIVIDGLGGPGGLDENRKPG